MTHRIVGNALLLASSCMASLVRAETPVTPAATTTSQMMSLFTSTAAVIALIVAAAWLLKRMAPRRYSPNNTLRVVAGAAVGQRERVVVVEIGTTWLVLGVAPGNVNMLHHLPRAEQPAEAAVPVNKARTFAQWLAQVSGKPQ